ncbi:Fasciclin-like arabinogalactan protein [Thalictrum thalictroides]|uniref:Fasciclin-like arabinogalactan protein n=1 Tax=Thalictrum thalictroides TaxID=46969 RepID=A0A7J6X695_THATH|nr:Fasciclin-like arabinogalactan protein [Thalictrum thalictroides]
MAASHIPLLFLLSVSLLSITTTTAHNISAILDGYPEYSLYNSYLSQTKLNDEINSRTTITCLVLNNGAMSALAGKHPLSVIKKALSLLVLLDYYDASKLHDISKGTTLTTTLYQTTGNAPGNLGFVNVTDLKGGKVGFGSAAPGSKLDSSYSKSVKQIPYNISVLEIDAPIIAPGILVAPAPASDVNITGLLEKAGCKTFVSLITSSGVLKIYETAAEKGLTVFAPSDEAFKAPGIPDLTKLSNAEVVTLLQYHALPGYTPIGTLKSSKAPISTLASNGASKYDLTVTTAGDSVTLDTGVDASRVSGTVLDSTPLCIFTVDSLLLPTELFGKSPSPAPSVVPEAAPSPTPVLSPSPTPEISSAPSPLPLSPPAPPTPSPEGSPAGSPDSGAATADSKSAGNVEFNAPTLIKTTLLAASAGLLALVL